MTETEQRSLILQKRYDLTIPERSLIERGLALAESLGKKEYICPILGAKFVLIPAGKFLMGSPEDEPGRFDNEALPHQVTISKSFYIQTTPVTQGQWKKVKGDRNNPSAFRGDDNLPVECVSWQDVQEFINNLNMVEGTNKYRLPTEAEWEYACRAGSKTAYFFGDNAGRLSEYAWYDDSGGKTHSVGQKKPNDWGLYDMHGNVWEWCQDCYDGNYNISGHLTDPNDLSSDLFRLVRGGSWQNLARFCRSAYRSYYAPDYRLFLGFRLLRTVDHVRHEPNQESMEAKQIAKSKEPVLVKVREISRDGAFIAFDNGTVLDTRTNLMWMAEAEDNWEEVNWQNAKRYCEDYRGGGYTDWRMPKVIELEELYNSGYGKLIRGCQIICVNDFSYVSLGHPVAVENGKLVYSFAPISGGHCPFFL
ncbi:MAG: SUMF1/EgtB/PvdO family nonheme iron enzyme, partial [Syntrophales bacterium]|nr:SUMF1/EgtB/PvdO family nonheme iron enzyme [Syntrophales bacterium]